MSTFFQYKRQNVYQGTRLQWLLTLGRFCLGFGCKLKIITRQKFFWLKRSQSLAGNPTIELHVGRLMVGACLKNKLTQYAP